MANINQKIAQELGVRAEQVEATVTLLDGGATVPFIARYRKEATGALDDAQLRTLEERLGYLRELEDRRKAILESVREQGKLDAALEASILAADSKARLEDIYLPFKPKRRTKAEIAREAGLEPLANQLMAEPTNDPKGGGGNLRQCREGRCRRRCGARRRPGHPGRAFRRRRRPDREPARGGVDQCAHGLQGA
ncbi:transcriptional accessory protein Tex/SPT6 [Bradyrhizobium sp. LM6.9]